MVMGQEERKNKAKLEKTQINLATTNTEYENAVKILQETTGRWNRDWKAAADKFQDLEEERLDFMKSSLWTFANIASTVCVSDDASCEKIRLALENCEVEKDIVSFIKERGTGQEIPDPPKYINFCRGDVSDSQSETSEDENYSVAQFQRTINPAYRSSSPQPSTYESHHEPHPASSMLGESTPTRETSSTPQKGLTDRTRPSQVDYQQQPNTPSYEHPSVSPAVDTPPNGESILGSQKNLSEVPRQLNRFPYEQQQQQGRLSYEQQQPMRPSFESPTSVGRIMEPQRNSIDRTRPPPVEYQQQQQPRRLSYEQSTRTTPTRETISTPMKATTDRTKPSQLDYQQHGPLAAVPHEPYPLDGMTMLCRTGPPSDRSSARPSSRDSQSEYSNPTSISSQEQASGKVSPVKSTVPQQEKQVLKKKSGFFQNHSPFRRKSVKEKDQSPVKPTSNRNTWSAQSTAKAQSSSKPPLYGQDSQTMIMGDRPSASPEPIDPRATFQLNVGNNVFDVATPDKNKSAQMNSTRQQGEELDPIAQALAELNGAAKASSTRVSADNYHGIATPAPGASPTRPGASQMGNGPLSSGMRGTPPPSYDQPVQRLSLPQPAFTAKAMQQTRQKYVDQTQNMFNPPEKGDINASFGSSTRSRRGSMAQPRPDSGAQSRPGTRGSDMPRATSPTAPRSASPRSVSPRPGMYQEARQTFRSASPNPYSGSQRGRAQSSSPQKSSDQGYYRQNSSNDSVRGASPAPFRTRDRPNSSHVSNMSVQLAPGPDSANSSMNGRSSGNNSGQMSFYEPPGLTRQRSKSVAEIRQYTREGRPILHFGKSMLPRQVVEDMQANNI